MGQKSAVLESEFINSNKQKWSDLEKDIKFNKTDIFEDFSQLSDDSSFSQTYYKNRSIRVYLNHVLTKLQAKMMNKRSQIDRNYGEFWTLIVPKALYSARKVLLISFIVFIAFTLIGYYSAAGDKNFVTEVFGDAYVTETIKNIEKGDPMGIYKQEEEVSMFFRIAFNNVRVGLFAFALGCLFGVGSLLMMVMNGIMIGAFMYFFYSRGLATDFNLAVWMHGTFEIAMLVIEAAAGFVMGLGLVNKGNYTTLQSFYISSKNGIHILIATIPFTLFAAFIESFLTRHTEIPNALRAIFIISCLLFTLFYFVVYPMLKHRQGAFKKEDNEVQVLKDKDSQILKYRQYKNPMQYALNALRQGLGRHLKWMAVSIIVAMIGTYFLGKQLLADINFGAINGVEGLEEFINMFANLAWLPSNVRAMLNSDYFLFTIPLFGIALYAIISKTLTVYKKQGQPWQLKKVLSFVFMFGAMIIAIHFLPFFFALITLPLFFSMGAAVLLEQNLGTAILSAFKYGMFKGNNWISLLVVFLVTYLVSYLLHSPLFWVITHFINLFYLKGDLAYSDLIRGILLGMSYITVLVFFVLYYLNVGANYLYNKEIDLHEEISDAIDEMEINKQILGFEVE